jgi:hypothetical protein
MIRMEKTPDLSGTICVYSVKGSRVRNAYSGFDSFKKSIHAHSSRQFDFFLPPKRPITSAKSGNLPFPVRIIHRELNDRGQQKWETREPMKVN